MYAELLSWVAVIELPLFAALFKIAMRQKREYEIEMGKNKDELSNFKIHVARNYVSTTQLKDVEVRLTDHLLRIEEKLDSVRKKR